MHSHQRTCNDILCSLRCCRFTAVFLALFFRYLFEKKSVFSPEVEPVCFDVVAGTRLLHGLAAGGGPVLECREGGRAGGGGRGEVCWCRQPLRRSLSASPAVAEVAVLAVREKHHRLFSARKSARGWRALAPAASLLVEDLATAAFDRRFGISSAVALAT